MTKKQKLKLSSRNDAPALQKRFADTGRVHIPDLFPGDIARQLADNLKNDMRWNLVTDAHGKHMDLDAAGMAAISKDDQDKFLNIVHEQAREGFQYLFKNYPIYDIYHHGKAPGHFLNKVFEFLNSRRFLTFIREVTGDETIGFADAQATCYESGHFLTCHDDNVDGKNRRCAFVLNLTREWQPDWGGALQFFGDDGHVEEAFLPTFNALNMFRVPQRHSVSIVAPFAGAPRLSITGWLRSGVDPMLAAAKEGAELQGAS